MNIDAKVLIECYADKIIASFMYLYNTEKCLSPVVLNYQSSWNTIINKIDFIA